MPFGFFDPTIILLIPALIFAMWAQHRVRSTYDKWSRVPSSFGRAGADVARTILTENALSKVEVQSVAGALSDHYDPRTKTVRLSEGIYHSRSVAALSVAAHECGHAIQDKVGYAPLNFRTAIVPISGFGSTLAIPLFLIGFIFGGARGQLSWLMDVGILLYTVAVAFHVITLPVEFNASSRAMAELKRRGYLNPEETRGAREVLDAAALTYVAATAMAALQLIRLLVLKNSRD